MDEKLAELVATVVDAYRTSSEPTDRDLAYAIIEANKYLQRHYPDIAA